MDVHCLCYFDMLLFCYMNMSYYAAREDAGDRRLAMQGGNFMGYGGGNLPELPQKVPELLQKVPEVPQKVLGLPSQWMRPR